METNRVNELVDQALACRKLAWTLTDQRTQALLHEIASEYEVRAVRAANGLEEIESRPMLFAAASAGRSRL